MTDQGQQGASVPAPGAAPTTPAEGWEKWHDWHSANMLSVGQWVSDAIAASPGMRVLDVGCGTGLPAFDVAARVRPEGSVVGVDVDPAMLAAAGRLAAAHGVTGLELREMSAQELAFEDGAFDAVTSCFCLMFCPDPARAVAEMRRVLRPGGSFAIVVWHARERNPFFTTLLGSIAQVFPMPAPDPRAPGQFRLGDEAELEAVVRAGGFEDFAIRSHELTMRSDSFDVHFASFSDMAPPLRNAIAQGNAESIERVRSLLAEALRPFTHDGKVAVPATALCAFGRG